VIEMKDFSKIMIWITFLYEAFLAIPILGGTFIIAFSYVPLVVACILHVITIIVGLKARNTYVGSIAGVVASVLGVIPILGWLLHCITALILFIEGISVVLKKTKE
jgi:uncharacterized membrane protein